MSKIPWKKLCATTKYLCAMAALCPEFVMTYITGWSSKWGNTNPTLLYIFIPLFPPYVQQ
jgi:hypothetical protein